MPVTRVILIALVLGAVVRAADPLPEGALRQMRPQALQLDLASRHIAVSPDGKLLAVEWTDGRVHLFDIETGKAIRAFQTRHGVNRLAFTDAKTLAVATASSGAEMWEVPKGQKKCDIQINSGSNCLAVSPDGRHFVTGNDDHLVYLCDARTGGRLREAKGHKALVSAVAFAPDNNLVASGSLDRALRWWSFDTGAEVKPKVDHPDTIAALAFVAGGKQIISGCADGKLRWIDAATGKIEHTVEAHRRPITALVLSPDGKMLASSAVDGAVRLWDRTTREELQKIEAGQAPAIGLAFTPDGKRLATSGDGPAHLWDVATGRKVRSFADDERMKPARDVSDYQTNWVWGVAFAPDGKTFVTGCGDTTVRLWDTATGKQLRELGRHYDHVWGVAFAPDGKTVASCARRDGTVRLWDPATGDSLGGLPSQLGGISRVVYSRDGQYLAAGGGSFDPAIYIWDVRARKLLHRLEGHQDYIDAVAFSQDRRTLLSADRRNMLCSWDVEKGKLNWSVQVERAISCLAVSSDGQHFAAGGSGGVTIWEWNGKRHWDLTNDSATSLIYAPDGKTLAAGLQHGSINVLEMASSRAITGRFRREWVREEHRRGSSDGVQTLAFSPDGRIVVSGTQEGVITMWDVTGQKGRAAFEPVTKEKAEQLWGMLAKDEGVEAHTAIWALALAPRIAIPLLEKQLKPATAPQRDSVTRWIRELDDDKFAVREKASEELEKLGGEAEGPLRVALAKNPSAELRRRVEDLLDRIQQRSMTGEAMRAWRALEVLENAATPEARLLLEKLAEGHADARRTREAKAILKRLAERR